MYQWIVDRVSAVADLIGLRQKASDEADGKQLVQRDYHWLSPRSFWIPTSPEKLAATEAKVLRHVKSRVEQRVVETDDGHLISTVIVHGPPETSSNTPLVLLHGFGGGAGIWCKNFDALSSSRTVYAIDMIGFGRSSRPVFSSDASQAEEQFVSSLEEWRRAVGLETFILGGHSLGGFVAASYALRYPEHLEHLVLVDCWGMPERPDDSHQHRIRLPRWVKVIAYLLQPFSPLAGLRFAGPFGPAIMSRLRPDLRHKYQDMFDDDTITEYLYHCNARRPSGELAMKSLSLPFGWAKNPMLPRLRAAEDDLPMTLVYGQRSWVDCSTGYKLKEERSQSYVDIHLIRHSGHHVYSDQSAEFNRILGVVCNRVTEQLSFESEE